MLACDASIAPDDFASDKSYFGQLCPVPEGQLPQGSSSLDAFSVRAQDCGSSSG
jgi:hypothetical protein